MPVVSISRLKKALGNLVWKQGVVSGPCIVTVPATIAVDDEPKPTRSESMGASSWASPAKT
jgi:hypothetical protein